MTTLTDVDQIPRIAARHPGLRALSIDLFDTLVFRKAFDPLDVFALQHGALEAEGLYNGQREGWTTLRKEAEHTLALAAAPHEIALADVYERIATILGWSPEQAKTALDTELRIEADLIEPYAPVVSALARLQRAGITIIVQTDTYLPAKFVREVLDGFMPVPFALRCSSETGAPKRSGLAYADLVRDYGDAVIHFGDNLAVDVRLARKAGVCAYHVQWPRAQLVDGSLQRRYAKSLGLHRVTTPRDYGPGTAPAELAFRWSLVLVDFMLAIRDYADAINATDIWLLSRDCESIADVADRLPGLLGARTVRYVTASRSSCHPILAVTDPKRFAAWGYTQDDAANAAGAAAIAYYRSQLEPQSRTVLLVDTGWKGRLQAAIASALPHTAVHGFYFALEPGAEAETGAQAATFLPWEPRTFNQTVVEALAGFTERSCARFAQDEAGRPMPVYKAASRDKSPQAYCNSLREQMVTLLQGCVLTHEAPTPERLRRRRDAVAQICAYPDRSVVAAFADWQIGIEAADSTPASLLSGGTASRLDRLLGRTVQGNVWPRAAVWSVVSRPRLVRAIYYADDQVYTARAMLKRLIGRGPASHEAV